MIKIIKNFWNWGWSIYHKNEEIWNYLISGALGVVVSIGVYWICRLIGFDIFVSNACSWIIAVIFMYITNKIFVFKSKSTEIKQLLKEFFSFIIARLLTLLIETLILWMGVELIKVNDIIVKVIAQIVIIILNYIFSKLIVFKKSKI